MDEDLEMKAIIITVALVIIMSLIIIFCSGECSGAETTSDEPIIIPVEKGVKITWTTWPFDGAYLNNEALAQILTEKKFEEEECNLKIQYNEAKLNARFDLELSNAQAHIDAIEEMYQERLNLKDEEIDKLYSLVAEQDNTDWSALFYAGGVVSGILLSIAITYALSPNF